MTGQVQVLKPFVIEEESIDGLIEETYNNFLSLRMDSTPYKVLLYLFWIGRISSPKRISRTLKLDLGAVKMAVRQLYKMGLISNPRRGIYGPNRDKCIALLLHTHRLLKEQLPRSIRILEKHLKSEE